MPELRNKPCIDRLLNVERSGLIRERGDRRSMNGPRTIETERLVLRKPTIHDAEAIFGRYASDPVVTRYI